jgi:dipeptidyl aminopeptidase/acylaminoacyl peptidase
LQPIFTNDGAYETSLSPDESKLLLRYSYKNKPWELFILTTKNAIQEQITFSTTPELMNAYYARSNKSLRRKME